MSHLSLEMLARLVDEAPTALEAAHLAGCDACRAELEQLHRQTSALSALPELDAPGGEWERVEHRLRREGLIRGNSRWVARGAWARNGMRAAAAVALLATGTLLGRSLGVAPTVEPSAAGSPTTIGAPPARVAEQSGGADVADPDWRADDPASYRALDPSERAAVDPQAGLERPERAAVRPRPAPALRLASTDTRRAPGTADEALEQLRAAEASYLDALTRFAEFSGGTAAGDPAARLAALEGIVLTTRAALGQAPTDPVINGYHLTALAQRDATLRQISATNNDSWF